MNLLLLAWQGKHGGIAPTPKFRGYCRYCLKSQQVNGKECGQFTTAIFVQIRNRIYAKSFTTQNS
jgi:hypothetical protein